MDKIIDQISNQNNSSTHLNFSYHVPFFLPLLEDDLQLSKKKRKKNPSVAERSTEALVFIDDMMIGVRTNIVLVYSYNQCLSGSIYMCVVFYHLNVP